MTAYNKVWTEAKLSKQNLAIALESLKLMVFNQSWFCFLGSDVQFSFRQTFP